jgi:hypothetical protein
LPPSPSKVKNDEEKPIRCKLGIFWETGSMRDVMEVLRLKEQELSKVKKQVEALRIALPLLGVEDDPLIPPHNGSNTGTAHLR